MLTKRSSAILSSHDETMPPRYARIKRVVARFFSIVRRIFETRLKPSLFEELLPVSTVSSIRLDPTFAIATSSTAFDSFRLNHGLPLSVLSRPDSEGSPLILPLIRERNQDFRDDQVEHGQQNIGVLFKKSCGSNSDFMVLYTWM